MKEKFEIDRECIRNIGRFKKRKDIYIELQEYSYHPTNLTFWRRRLNQRLSTRRVLLALKDLPQSDTSSPR